MGELKIDLKDKIIGYAAYTVFASLVVMGAVHFWQHWDDPWPLSSCFHFGEMTDLPATDAHWYHHCSQAPGRMPNRAEGSIADRVDSLFGFPMPPAPWMHCTARLYRGEVVESVPKYPRCEPSDD
jgi:hypothetical protein